MPTIKDILAPIMPRLIDHLLRLAGNKTQGEIWSDANTISRYRSGKHAPTINLPKLGAAAGLSLKSTGWLLGHLLVEEYEDDSFDLGALPEEVREPEPRYDDRSLLARDLDEVLALDFTVLEAHEMVNLNLERNALSDACEEVLAGIDRQVEAHLKLVSSFKKRCEAVLRKARVRGR